MISVVVISKDEPDLGHTLSALEQQVSDLARQNRPVEILVVDASCGRLDGIRDRHRSVRWIAYEPPPGLSVTIPHQRNIGVGAARGEVVVFTDAGCIPRPRWLSQLVTVIEREGEDVVAGGTVSMDRSFRLYDTPASPPQLGERSYLRECPTINLAFRRAAYDDVGGFDETFRYGSDVDFSWRLISAGYHVRSLPGAVVEANWGDWRRQLRRSFAYGRARVNLYRHHPDRLPRLIRDDPVVLFWPLFIVGLPIAARHPSYLLLLAVPAWRNRHRGATRVIVDHLAYGAGALVEVVNA